MCPLAPSAVFDETARPMKKKSGSAKTAESSNLRPFSGPLLDGPNRAAARAMLYPVGFTEEDFKKPLIGIASTWGNVTPCNMHIDKLALEAEKGANAGGGKAIVFNTITVSDGISNGNEAMKYSLVSREVIADSIETVVGCGGMDGYVAIGGCDKNMPGALICMARMNRPAVPVHWRKARSSTSFPFLKQSANTRRASSATKNCTPWNPARFPDQAPAAACIPPTPWPARLKHSA
jgi:hypothetical protein